MIEQPSEPSEKIVVRSVRYKKDLYEWLQQRGNKYIRSVQSENTYLLDALRKRPDILRLLEESLSKVE